jgi:hypothetical protein
MKKLYSSLTVAIFVVLTGFFLMSCEKEIEVTNQKNEISEFQSIQNYSIADMPAVEVIDGILSFRDEKDYFQAVSIISNLSEKERRAWEESIGFVSLRTLQENALDQIQNVEDEKVIYAWLEKYKDLFEVVVDEKGEQEIVEKNNNLIYSCLFNSNNIYEVSKHIYFFENYNIYIIPISKKEEILNLNKNIQINQFPNYCIKRNEKEKPDKHKIEAISDEWGCANDRKVRITNSIVHFYVYDNGIYYYEISVNTEVNGFQRVACIWAPYNTTLTYKDVHGEVYYNLASSYKNFNFGTKNSINEVKSLYNSIVLISGTTTSNFVVLNMLYDVYFRKDYGEGSSRGVGDLWAIIKYNY